MDIKISEYTLKATTKCEKDFSCLSGRKECLCKIEYPNEHHTILIKTRPDNFCTYLLHLNASTYCLCPTRNEIYIRYKI